MALSPKTVHITARAILGGTRTQERTKSTKKLLKKRNKQRPRNMGFTGEKAEVAALDRHGWHRSVAQCVQLDAG